MSAMYDDFSAEYDRFVNWPARLALELPFIEYRLRSLKGAGDARVLDAACGTGMHTIALAQRGFLAAGADLSAPMIERARANALAAGVAAHFAPAGFGELAPTFGEGSFDALLCLGNSLPHVLTPEALDATLADFAACLPPGGMVLIQNRNFDGVCATHQRWMEPQSHRQGGDERIFVRFYDFDPDGLITFNVLRLQRQGEGEWTQHLAATRLRPLAQMELKSALETAGFGAIEWFGDMGGAPFDPQRSGNLVAAALRQ